MGRPHTLETKQKISNSLKGRRVGNAIKSCGKQLVPLDIRICPSCALEFTVKRWLRKKYCSIKCASKLHGGLRPNSGKKGSWYNCRYLDKMVYLDSTWELKYANWLDKNNISWSRGMSFCWIDMDNVSHLYYPDFYLIDDDIYIDIKNDYLIIKDEYKINYVRQFHNIKLNVLSKFDLDNLRI